MNEVVFDINAITVPFKVWGIWFLLEVFKPTSAITNLIEISVKFSRDEPGIYFNASAFGYGVGISLLK